MPRLFDPLTIREITFRNRVFMSPMCMYSSKDGMPSDWHIVHLTSRAIGGAALVIAEASGGLIPHAKIQLGAGYQVSFA